MSGATISGSLVAWLQAETMRDVVGFTHRMFADMPWLFCVGIRLAGYRDCRSYEASVRSEAVCAGQRLVRQQGGQEVSDGGTVGGSSHGGRSCRVCSTNIIVHVAKINDAKTLRPVSREV